MFHPPSPYPHKWIALPFMQFLQDPAYGIVQELEGILNTFNPAPKGTIALLNNLDKKCQKHLKSPLTSQ